MTNKLEVYTLSTMQPDCDPVETRESTATYPDQEQATDGRAHGQNVNAEEDLIIFADELSEDELFADGPAVDTTVAIEQEAVDAHASERPSVQNQAKFIPSHRNPSRAEGRYATTSKPLREGNHAMGEEKPMWTILIVDDEPEVHQVTKLALQRFTYAGRSLRFLSAHSTKEAEVMMAAHPEIAVVLLDVVMETNHAGLDFVHYLRKELNNQRTRIILRTGQPGEAPEESIIREYDINDYKTKTELTRQKLCTTILVSLRTYEQLVAFEANQNELEILYTHLAERNTELQQAKDLAEAMSSAKDEFLSLMNHELRTPLNVILMRAEILDNGVYGHLSVKQKKSLDLIRNSGHHLLSIIDDILDLAGIETGKLSVTRRRIPANDSCIQSVDAVQGIALEKQIDVELVLPSETVFVYADERRLIQVLDKLLQNAVKFSSEAGTIGLKLHYDEAAGDAHITVWDQGIGIASMDIARLFQPFVQLEHSLTRRHDGAGLGLSIASRLTQLMGGTISVDSAPGEGSRFTVTLPTAIQA